MCSQRFAIDVPLLPPHCAHLPLALNTLTPLIYHSVTDYCRFRPLILPFLVRNSSHLVGGKEPDSEPMLLLRDLTDIYTPAGAIGSPEDVLRRAKGTDHL